MLDADEARRHLATLASRPRPASGGEERQARQYCARLLSGYGFSVTEEPFEYSTAPGRLATPLAGAASIVVLAIAGHLAGRGRAATALAVLVLGGAGLAVVASWTARRGVLALPLARAAAVNLSATRGAPTLWLVAHLDSKSQPVPILVRALGVMASIALWSVALLLVALQLVHGADLLWAWPWIAGAGVVAGLPVAASVVRSRSPGALDNASGVAAVLLLAHALAAHRPLGVLLTSAEELGLAGARAWVRGRAPATAINFDGLDDGGRLRYTFTGRRPKRLLSVLLRAAREAGVPASAGRLFPGVLLDGVALADAGWQVATVSQGSLRTVARIHTPRDDVTRLNGVGIARAAAVVLRALEELT